MKVPEVATRSRGLCQCPSPEILKYLFYFGVFVTSFGEQANEFVHTRIQTAYRLSFTGETENDGDFEDGLFTYLR